MERSEDAYVSVSIESEATFRDRGSKFLAFCRPVESEEEVQYALQSISADHPKANHLCYAYRLGVNGHPYRANDDGEPSGSAGKPILNAILSAGISDIFIGVVRYFGGTKLGVPGLINAYSTSADMVIAANDFRQEFVTVTVRMYYPVADTGRIYDILKRSQVSSYENHYGTRTYMKLSVRATKVSETIHLIKARYMNYAPSELDQNLDLPDLTFEIDGVGR
ncbi:MAG: YigZ family protein [Bacteroidota bacterium]